MLGIGDIDECDVSLSLRTYSLAAESVMEMGLTGLRGTQIAKEFILPGGVMLGLNAE